MTERRHRPAASTPARSGVVVLLALLALLAAAGCGEQAPPDSETTPQTSRSTAETPGATGTPPATDPPTTPPSGPAEKVRVTGEVVRADECVVVRDANGITWTIQGAGAAKLALGERVLVVGAPDLAALGCEGSLVRASRITSLPQE